MSIPASACTGRALLVDLRDAPLPLLERCMGKAEVQTFLEAHGRRVPTGVTLLNIRCVTVRRRKFA